MELFRIPCRTNWLIEKAALLRDHIVGYCDGGSVPCRPKPGTIAVMCYKDGCHSWFHLRRNEFDAIVGNPGPDHSPGYR